MDNYYELIANIICEIARIIVTLRYCSIFMKQKHKSKIKYLVMGAVAVVTIAAYWVFHNMWINLMITLTGIYAATLFYKGSIKNKILLSILIYVISALMDLIAAFIVVDNPSAENQNMTSSFLSVILLLISVIILEKIYAVRAEESRMREELRDQHWIYLLLLSVTSICAMLIIVHDTSIRKGSMLSIITVFVVVNFIVYGLYITMEDRYMKMIENQNLKNQLSIYDRQIQLNIDNEKQIRTLKHDMKHHLRELYGFASNHEDDKIQEYISQMIDSVSIDKMISTSGNTGIDGIINYMCAIAKNKLIEIEVTVTIPDNLKVNAYDFNIILGNLLENAIEASEKIENPYIKFSMNYTANCIFICIENKFSGEIKDNGKFLSLKGKDHGLGMESVKTIVEKYNGTFDCNYNNEIFIVKVSLLI